MSTGEQPLRVTRSMDVSIASLMKKMVTPGEAYSRRAPHIGSWSINNLICAAYGIPSHVLDYNVVGVDKSYLNKDNAAVSKIIDRHGAEKGKPSALYPGLVDDFLDPVKRLFPKTEIITSTQLYEKLGQKFDLEQVFKSIADASIQLGMWKRYVGEDGFTHKIDESKKGNLTWDLIKKGGIFGVSDTKKGWVIPTEVSILVESVLLTALKGADTSYELAGRDMHLYIRGMVDSLRALYDGMSKGMKGTGLIADKHHMIVTTTLGLRFAVLQKRKTELDEFVKMLHEYRSVMSRRRKDPQLVDLVKQRQALALSQDKEKINAIDVEIGKISKPYQDEANRISSQLSTQMHLFPDLVAARGSDVKTDLDQFKLIDELEQMAQGSLTSLYVIDEICRDMTFKEINELLVSVDFMSKKILQSSGGRRVSVALAENLARDEEI